MKEAPTASSAGVIRGKGAGQEGHLLYTTGHRLMAILADRDGEELHRWTVRFNDIWDDYPIEKSHPGRRYLRSAKLLPDGELVAIVDGLGLVKLDKNSKVRWRRVNRAHHDLDVGPEGRIHVLTRLVRPRGVDADQVSVIEDFVTVMTAAGATESSTSLIDVLEPALAEELQAMEPAPDLLVANGIQVLTGDAVARFPGATEGDVLLSLPKLSMVAVLNVASEQIVWTGRGTFRSQQDVSLVSNGNLLVMNGTQGSEIEVLEIDPRTMETVWSSGVPSETRGEAPRVGRVDRLPGGGTLVVDTANGRAVELGRGGEVVWEFVNPHRMGEKSKLIAQLPQIEQMESIPLGWLAEVKVAKEQGGESKETRSSSGRKSKRRKR